MTMAPLSPSLTRELACWREAWQLRRQNPRWVVFWDAETGRYGAYRLSRARRGAILAAATPDDLASQIAQARRGAG
jgi:hypothetical protein